MAHDLEPVNGPDIDPYHDDVVPTWYQAPEVTERPEWTELRTPFHPDSRVEEIWSQATLPFRAVALGFLWITYTWVRSAVLVGVIALIIILFTAR